MTAQVRLADGQAYVEGRSEAKAQELLTAAKGREGEVLTTSFGYIVPKDILTEELGEDLGEIDAEEKRKAEEEEAARLAEIEANKPFDPSTASVNEVNEYLQSATEDERTRVLAEEKAGKNRVSIVGSDEEGAK